MKLVLVPHKKWIVTEYASKIFCTLVILFFASLNLKAQVGIGITSPDPSAQLDITSPGKGLLIPRMDKDAKDGITDPATGLLIYQTNQTPGFYYYNGTAWKLISTDNGIPPVSGFSATISSTSISASSTTFTNYSVVSPFYSGTGFNAAVGRFTVQETGKYAITATINFQLNSAASTSLGPTVNPIFQVVQTSPASKALISGSLPILNVNIVAVLSLRALLGSGVVTLAGNAELSAGDVLELTYAANGLTQAMNITSASGPGLIWSVTKL